MRAVCSWLSLTRGVGGGGEGGKTVSVPLFDSLCFLHAPVECRLGTYQG